MSKLSLISIILGIVLLGAAGYTAYSQQQSLSSGVQIEATVESKEVTMDSSKSGDKYTPPRHLQLHVQRNPIHFRQHQTGNRNKSVRHKDCRGRQN